SASARGSGRPSKKAPTSQRPEPSSRSCRPVTEGGGSSASSAPARRLAAVSPASAVVAWNSVMAGRSAGLTSGPRTPARARSSRGADADADWAGHAGAADAAVAAGVLREIPLVVVLGEVEGRRRADLGRDGP